MKDRYTDAIQNRFTAYLQAAIANRKASYFGKRNRILAKEIVFEDQSYKSYLDFEIQYHDYQVEQSAFIVMDWERFEEFITTLESRGLFHALDGLKERHKKILFARLFGELTFREIGEKFGMTEKQAEAIRQIHWMYRPLLIKNAMELGIFDEDLYQELCAALLQCIRMFTI